MKLALGRYVLFQEFNGQMFLGLGSKQQEVTSIEKWNTILDLCEKAKKGTTLDQLNLIDEASSAPGTLQYLLDNNFIIKPSVLSETSRYSRTFYYYQSLGLDIDETEKRLKKASVTILGCGGIGNHISAALATNGIGQLNLVDADHIELTNLTRQILFSENDVDKKKVEVLGSELESRNSDCIIKAYDEHILNESDLSKLPETDLYVVSADSPNLLNVINKYCLDKSIPYINVGYMNDIAVWGPFVIPNETGCHNCGCLRLKLTSIETNAIRQQRLDALNMNFKSATFPPINGTASSLATGDIIRYLAGSRNISSLNKRIGVHDQTLKVEVQDFSKNNECTQCQSL